MSNSIEPRVLITAQLIWDLFSDKDYSLDMKCFILAPLVAGDGAEAIYLKRAEQSRQGLEPALLVSAWEDLASASRKMSPLERERLSVDLVRLINEKIGEKLGGQKVQPGQR